MVLTCIMIVVMGIGTNNQDYDFFVDLDVNNDNNSNINGMRVSSYEYDNYSIYDKLLNLINENNSKYDKFNVQQNKKYIYESNNISVLSENKREKSKPIPIPKPNYL